MNNKLVLTDRTSLRINIIRIFAAWCVMIGHGFVFFQISIFKSQQFFCYLQNIGVVLLLLLAGFLLLYSLSKKGDNYTFKEFAIDKVCRIQVPLFFALLLSLIFDLISTHLFPSVQAGNDHTVLCFLGNVFMLQLYPAFGLRVSCFGSAAQLWTLSVEWWIYFVTGLFILLLSGQFRRHSRKAMFSLLIAVAVIYSLLEYSQIGIVHNAPMIMIIGMILFYAVLYVQNQLRMIIIILGCLFLFLALISGLIIKDAYAFSFIVPLACFLIMFFSSSQKIEKNSDKCKRIFSHPIRFLANYTYSLYLVHYSVFDLFYRKWLTDNCVGGGMDFIFSIAISNLIAILFASLFEKKLPRIISVWLKQKTVSKNQTAILS